MAANHQDGQSETLLTTEFLLYPKDCRVVAKLTTTTIIITPQSTKGQSQKEEIINLSDVTGCHVTEGNCTTSTKWHVCIFAYPLRKKLIKGTVRHKTSRSLGIPIQSEDGRSTAELWKRAIKHLIHGRHVKPDEVKDLPEPQRRNLVVYINPFSGQGKSMHIYKSHVKKMFAESEIQHTVVETEYPGHARVLARELLLRECDGIVIVSGDGLVHEVLNGLMDRDDWAEAIKTPIGIVPGGSGNALAASIVYASTGQHISSDLITDAMFEVIRGRNRGLSLVYIQSSKESYFSFLNVGWGFVADVDIESEKYRSLGNARFTVGCAVRVANLRKYHGMISYLPLENGEATEKSTKQSLDVTGTEFKRKLSEKNDETQWSEVISKDHVPFAKENKCVYHLSMSLQESLPTKWRSIEGEFVWIMPVYLSHIGKDMFMMPRARLDEDIIYLYCLKSDVGRRQLLNILLSIADGKHLDISPESTVVVPCKAFRLEPFTNTTGLLTVDGEAIPHEPLQATITPIKAKIMCSSI